MTFSFAVYFPRFNLLDKCITLAKFVLNRPVLTMLLDHAHIGSQDLRAE